MAQSISIAPVIARSRLKAILLQVLILLLYLAANILLLCQQEWAVGSTFLLFTVTSNTSPMFAEICFVFIYFTAFLLITIWNSQHKNKNIQYTLFLLIIIVLVNLILLGITFLTRQASITYPTTGLDQVRTAFFFRQNPLILSFIIAALFFLIFFLTITGSNSAQQHLEQGTKRIQKLSSIRTQAVNYLFPRSKDSVQANSVSPLLNDCSPIKGEAADWADSTFMFQFLDFEIAGGLKFLDIVGADYYDVCLEDEKKRKGFSLRQSNRLLLSLFDICGHDLADSWYLNDLIRFIRARSEYFQGKDVSTIFKSFCTYIKKLAEVYSLHLPPITVPYTLCQLDSSGEIKIIYNEENFRPVWYSSEHKRLVEQPWAGSIPHGEEGAVTKVNPITLKAGEILIVATDGLGINLFQTTDDEAIAKQMESYLLAKTEEISTASALTTAILEDLKRNAEARLNKDDVTFMVIKRKGGYNNGSCQ